MRKKYDTREFGLLAIICISMFLIPLTITSSSIFNLYIMKRFDVGYTAAQWFINIFMIFYGAFLAISGAISDFYGRKTIFNVGVCLFFSGFLVGGIANNYSIILIARAISGIGAAAMTTSGTALLAENISDGNKEKCFSIFGASLGAGMVAGPLIASKVNELSTGWFNFSMFISVLLLIIMIFSVRLKDKSVPHKVSVDWLGSILLTACLLSIVLWLSFFPVWGWDDFKSIFCILFSCGTLLYLLRVEKKSNNPIINISILKNKIFVSMCMTSLMLGLGFISILFYIPFFLKSLRVFTDLDIGIATTIATLPSFLIPPAIANVREKVSGTALLFSTLIFLVISPLILCFVLGSYDISSYYVPLFLLGCSFGISLSFLDGMAVSSIPLRYAGVASGTFNTFRIGGEAISIPFVSSFIMYLNAQINKNETLNFLVSHVYKKENILFVTMDIILIFISLFCFLLSIYVVRTMLEGKKEGVSNVI